MTVSHSTSPEKVATGHLVLTVELLDEIREELLGLLDAATRRLQQGASGGERPDPSALSEAIEEIQSALLKLDEGSYGVCDGCKQPMPFERLQAIPAARLCVSCQARPRTLLG